MPEPSKKCIAAHVKEHGGGVEEIFLGDAGHGLEQRPCLDDVLEERLEDRVAQFAHGLKVVDQATVDEIWPGIGPDWDGHGALEHPGDRERGLVCIDETELLFRE